MVVLFTPWCPRPGADLSLRNSSSFEAAPAPGVGITIAAVFPPYRMTRSRRSLDGRMSLLAEVGALLASTLDQERTLPGSSASPSPLSATCAPSNPRRAERYSGGARASGCGQGDPGVRGAHRRTRGHQLGPAHRRLPGSEADLMTEAQNADQLRRLQQLRPRAWLVLPLTARDRVLGALTFARTESAGAYDPRGCGDGGGGGGSGRAGAPRRGSAARARRRAAPPERRTGRRTSS